MNPSIAGGLHKVLMDGLKDMVFVMRVTDQSDFIYEFVNRPARKKTGISEQDLGKTIREVMPHEIIQILYKYYNKVLSTQSAVTYDDSFFSPSGEKRFSEVALTPLFDEQEGLYLIVAVIKDVTKEKTAELEKREAREKLEENLKRFRIIAENAQDMIMLLDANGMVKYASPSCTEVLGHDHQAYVGQSFLHNVHPEDQARAQEAITQAIDYDQSFTIRLKQYNSDDQTVWVESRGTPVFDQQDNLKDLVVVTRDISLQKDYESKLEYAALHDPLTNMPNRRLFMERLTECLEQLDGHHDGLAIIMMDIDRFKFINDELGHDMGDEVIKEFGERVHASVRECDMVARLGGDEFIALLPVVGSMEHAVSIAEDIQKAIQLPWHINGYHLDVTTSMGIATASKPDITAFSILKSADIALYQAKKAGRNSYKLGE
ncbi:Histidine kinase [Lentibacillus sp. JNUCC-1]|uniref:GGDEF domain-containing protein n=1 Tax=Lentibacillus sp. JNUCC-1 TaxID=2654513 RepID=UPI0013273FC1|nr:GGDEF domain-containing protein [Lentibacillus sp. JNUCC-1]MUV37796.1 Histidine kinase [Lentibacillus sp. JNUCC-1]